MRWKSCDAMNSENNLEIQKELKYGKYLSFAINAAFVPYYLIARKII